MPPQTSPGRRFFITYLLLLSLGAGVWAESIVPAGARFIMSHFKHDGGGGDERL